jgi:hypothetical protein
MTTTSKFATQFDGMTSLDGSEYIEATIRPGLTVRAYAEYDATSSPADWSAGEFDADEVAAWEADEWSFARITLHVYFDGRRIVSHIGGMTGIQHDEAGEGRALNEAADELLEEVESEAVQKVKEFAKAATKATR